MLYLYWAAWGFCGGFIVEALQLSGAIRRSRGWPWRRRGEPKLAPYLVSVLLRLVVGAVLAAGLGGEGQLGGPLSALVVGIAAPLIVEQLSRGALARTGGTGS